MSGISFTLSRKYALILIDRMSTSSRRLTASGSRLIRYTLALVSTLARIILVDISIVLVFLLLRYDFFEDLERKPLVEAILKRFLLVALITLATLAIIILVTISTLATLVLGVGSLRLFYTYVRIDSRLSSRRLLSKFF